LAPMSTNDGIAGAFPSRLAPWHSVQFAAKRDRPCASGEPVSEALPASCNLSIAGKSFETTKTSPLLGFAVVPPQLTPPLFPGISTVLPSPGGVNKPLL